MTPRSAALTTLLVPGLAHAKLDQRRLALFAFATAVGLFWLGYAIVADRIWFCELITFDTSGSFAPIFNRLPIQLLPESPNFGSTVIASFLRDPDSPSAIRLTRMPRDFEHIGLLLTGASGIIAALWASDAHWRARNLPTVTVAPAWAAATTWLLPGSGHVLVGQKSKGILFGAAILTLFAFGLIVANGHAADRPAQSGWWIADSLCGIGVIFSSLVTAPMRMTEFPHYRDLGAAVCAAAGLANLIAMVNAYTIAEEQGMAAAGEAP